MDTTMLGLALALALPAHAFQLETVFTEGCHEEITRGAIVVAGWPSGARAPAGSRTLQDNLPFRIPADEDAWTTATLIGARDNDLHGVGVFSFNELAEVHQSELYQEEHCLRGPDDDGDEGDERALAACRRFILTQLEAALGADDVVDLEDTESVTVVLRHETRDLDLPRYAFHLGRALHAVQDFHTHTLRDDDSGLVQHVTNYVDPATASEYDELRDGWPHQAQFDDCRDGANAARLEGAQVRSAEILQALADDDGGRAGRLHRIEAILDQMLARDASCTPDNRFCGSVDDLPVGCNANGAGVPCFFVVVLLLLRRRRSSAAALVALVVVAAAAPANAGNVDHFGLASGGSLSVDNGGGAAFIGARWRARETLTLGVDVELNPWFDVASASVAPGTANLVGNLSWRWFEFENGFALFSGARVGAAMLLFDAAGARTGDVGPLLGASLLGVYIPLNDTVLLEIEPLGGTLSVPHLGGVPLVYKQYRFALGVTWLF